MTVVPGEPGAAAVDEVADPARETGGLLVRGLLVGLCGTDCEIAKGAYGEAPSGLAKLIIGHECLGEVLQAPEASGFQRGYLIVGIVRRPDPVPCPACTAGEWDMCRNDRFCERGIVREHGVRQRAVARRARVRDRDPDRARRARRRLEPASVLAKAWEQVDRISQRAFVLGRRALVTRAGPIGLLGIRARCGPGVSIR